MCSSTVVKIFSFEMWIVSVCMQWIGRNMGIVIKDK